eukprot:UN00580
MISNPSKSKNSRKDMFIYNYNAANPNGILIDYDDDHDFDMQQSIINDMVLLGNNLNGNEDEAAQEDDDLRSQAMSVLSTGSEAAFQQKLFIHIKNENTFFYEKMICFLFVFV